MYLLSKSLLFLSGARHVELFIVRTAGKVKGENDLLSLANEEYCMESAGNSPATAGHQPTNDEIRIAPDE